MNEDQDKKLKLDEKVNLAKTWIGEHKEGLPKKKKPTSASGGGPIKERDINDRIIKKNENVR